MAIPNHRQALMGVARAVKQCDPELELEARRALAAAVVANHIEKVLADAPRLTPAEVRELSALLRAGGQRDIAPRVPPAPVPTVTKTEARK